MKIVDLIIKIANGEEVPKKIIYNNVTLEYDEEKEDYYPYYASGLFEYLFGSCLSFLNDEVEIIEEPKKLEIPKHIPNEVIQDLDRAICPANVKCIAHKINEIINYLQYKENNDE